MGKVRLVTFPGDGIGPEVLREALKIVKLLEEHSSLSFKTTSFDIGGVSIDRFGVPLTKEALEAAKNADAVLLGAIGGPKWDNIRYEIRPESALLALRKELEVFGNLRPIKAFYGLEHLSPLRKDYIEGVDLLLVRELTSGIYFGSPRGIFEDETTKEPYGVNTLIYRKSEVERIARFAFELARDRKHYVTNVDKSNVLDSSKFWRENVLSVHSSLFPETKLDHLLVDTAAMRMIQSPKQFDVVLTTNMFGDILTDEAACIVGSIGLLPSASIGISRNAIGGYKGLYEPIHGSAPDIAGKGIANPIGTLLSIAMMLRISLKKDFFADCLEKSIVQALQDGYRTKDLCRNEGQFVSTSRMGEIIGNNMVKMLDMDGLK